MMEERLKVVLVLPQGVSWQPKVTINKVEGKNSLLYLLPVFRRPGNHVEEVVVAHDDSLIFDGIPDYVVVL